MSKIEYWHGIEFTSFYQPEEKYIIFNPYNAGFNNVRMSYEIACVMAYALNRILVLPEALRINHLLQSSNLNYNLFFDANNIGISAIERIEFDKKNNIKDAFAINNISQNTLYKLDESETPDYFSKNAEGTVINLYELYDAKILYFPGNLFGNFYHAVQSNRMIELCRYVAKHLHYKSEIFSKANNCINKLGDKNYYSIHVRRGDFNSGWLAEKVVLPAKTILDNIENVIPSGSTLYIATDEIDKNFFNPFKEKYNIFFYDDIKEDDTVAEVIGNIEQLICSRSITFVGSFASTFSSYITRLRGYMPDIIDKRFITFSDKYSLGTIDTENYMGLFVREYTKGWRF